MSLALGTVVLRIWSRFAVKGRLAVDDVLILLGTVSEASTHGFQQVLIEQQELRNCTNCYVLHQRK